ncbi:MAG: DUF255 domain-containing protein [Bacteroidota bacterium]|nr:DUF255 domain-containing protein [Bacteroidota bacterium]
MKRIKLALLLVVSVLSFNIMAQENTETEAKVEWMDVETALASASKQDKPLFIDCYTSWCGWCKVLDQKTFSNDTVARILNKYYYPVKFDAEGSKDITINGKVYHAQKNAKGKYSTHELMSLLWEGQRGGGYPSLVIRKGDFSPVTVEMGYRSAADLEPLLVYFAKGYNKKVSMDKFIKNYIKDYRAEVLKEIF